MFHVSLPLLLRKERVDHFIEGLLILKTVMENAKIHLALSYPLTKWLYDFSDRLKDQPDVFYYTVKPKYPQHLDGVLIPTLLKKKLPYGCLPANIGLLTLRVQDVLHVYDAVVNGKPLIEKLIALTGPGFEQRPYLLVKVGTLIQEIITSWVGQDTELRFVLNSLATGTTIENLNNPICRDYRQIIALPERKEGEILAFTHPGLRKDSYSNTFLSSFLPFLPLLPAYLHQFCWTKKRFTTNINGEKRGCLSCGFCSNCCPARLYPNLLHHYVEREKFDEPLVRYGIFNCIDCNLCTYVCPSKIPVAELLKFGKKKLVEEGFHPYEQESFADLQEIDEYRGLP
jgi:Na+-translocating ferredoxin:NAD+ oxidoreductase RnfC subunit